MKVIGYIRVSTEEQARKGVSLLTQREKIEAWVQAMDRELISLEEDAGISGKLIRNREGFQRALELACGHRAVSWLSTPSQGSHGARETPWQLQRGWSEQVLI